MNDSTHTLDLAQLRAVVAAAKDRFGQIRAKYPQLRGYVILSIPGKQTGIGSSPQEILSSLPATFSLKCSSLFACFADFAAQIRDLLPFIRGHLPGQEDPHLAVVVAGPWSKRRLRRASP